MVHESMSPSAVLSAGVSATEYSHERLGAGVAARLPVNFALCSSIFGGRGTERDGNLALNSFWTQD